MKRTSRHDSYGSLRAYVEAQPRTVKQSEIAARLGLAPSHLSMYLHGHRRPSREVALRLSRDFSIDLRGLLDPKEAA